MHGADTFRSLLEANVAEENGEEPPDLEAPAEASDVASGAETSPNAKASDVARRI